MITENTLPRFFAKEIKCGFCGNTFSKMIPNTYKKNEMGDVLRVWDCPVCPGSYLENVSELLRMGLW